MLLLLLLHDVVIVCRTWLESLKNYMLVVLKRKGYVKIENSSTRCRQ